MTKADKTGSCRVYCNTVQRTAKNLRLVVETLRREELCRESFDAGADLTDCESLQRSWKRWCELARPIKGGSENRFRLTSALKGTKVLFDEPCRICDERLGKLAKEKWAQKALFSEQFTDPAVLADIKKRARKIMGRKWWHGAEEWEGVPDQQGCAELERGCGGTLGVTPIDFEADTGFEHMRHSCLDDHDGICTICLSNVVESADPGICRLGVAKSKGKMRVVTMQGARTKRLLRPVHDQAYNRLSSMPWLVRGDVTEEHFRYVNHHVGPNQLYCSGDYSDSTNNLNSDAVLACVEVLAEPLDPLRSKLLVDSFATCWTGWKGENRRIVRGSMMGNLCSFVVLCLLNRICYDRALDKSNYFQNHPAIFNGDDCFFVGCDRLSKNWLRCTAEVGFVINLDKTMKSARYGELNSTVYDYSKERFVRKLCFGFLGSDSWKQPEESLATPLFELCDRVRFSTSAWLLNTFPIRALLSRAPPPPSSFPRRWWGFLVKKRWFRSAMWGSHSAVVETGSERKLPYVLGPPLKEEGVDKFSEFVPNMERMVIAQWVGNNVGIPLPPREAKRPPLRARKLLPPRGRMKKEVVGWRRLWFRPILEWFNRCYPELVEYGNPVWVADQPDLHVEHRIRLLPHPKLLASFAPPPLFDSIQGVAQTYDPPMMDVWRYELGPGCLGPLCHKLISRWETLSLNRGGP